MEYLCKEGSDSFFQHLKRESGKCIEAAQLILWKEEVGEKEEYLFRVGMTGTSEVAIVIPTNTTFDTLIRNDMENKKMDFKIGVAFAKDASSLKHGKNTDYNMEIEECQNISMREDMETIENILDQVIEARSVVVLSDFSLERQMEIAGEASLEHFEEILDLLLQKQSDSKKEDKQESKQESKQEGKKEEGREDKNLKSRGLEEILKEQGKLVLTAEGNSMLPCIRPKKDVLILEPVKEEVCRHQVILYRRENGAYVLHRVMENSDHNSYVLCGDNQYRKEYGVQPEQILAALTGFYRGNQYIDCEKNKKYKQYVKLWCSPLFPRRCAVWAVKAVMKIRSRASKR